MATDDLIEVELLGVVQGGDPVEGIAIAHVGRPTVERVTGDDHFFAGKIDEDVAVSVGVAEPENLDGSRLAVEDQAVVEGHRRQNHLHALELGQVGFGLRQLASQLFFLFRVRGFFQIPFQLFDFQGHGQDFMLHARDAALFDIQAGRFRRDNFDARGPGTRIGLIALVVVPVKVSVHDVAHWLVREFLDLLDERPRGRGFGVRVHDEHAVVEQNDRGVAVDLVRGLGDGGVDAVGDGLDVEEVFGGCRVNGRE